MSGFLTLGSELWHCPLKHSLSHRLTHSLDLCERILAHTLSISMIKGKDRVKTEKILRKVRILLSGCIKLHKIWQV